jgi:hypothetical protein
MAQPDPSPFVRIPLEGEAVSPGTNPFAISGTFVKKTAAPAKVALRNDLHDRSSKGFVICGVSHNIFANRLQLPTQGRQSSRVTLT